MKLGAYLCKIIKGTIQNPLRCIALAGMAFGITAVWLLFVLAELAHKDAATALVYGPLLLQAFFALVGLLAVIILTFLGFRSFRATLPGGASFELDATTQPSIDDDGPSQS